MGRNKSIIKRNVKDSVFCDLFDEPDNQLQLYRLIHPEDTDAKSADFKTVTINNILTDQLYNDLGFTVRNKLLLLVEAQSSWSINIILRILLYLAQTLKEYIISSEKNVYGSRRIDIPKPEFYVIYTGTDKKNVNEWYSLADEFLGGDHTFINISVKVLQASEGSRDIVSQYVEFTRILNSQIRAHGRTEDAVRKTIEICKDQDILKKYLSRREQEVISIMKTLFSQEEAARAYGTEKLNEGRKEGSELQARKTARNLANAGFTPEQIAAAIDYSVADVEKWLNLQTI